jgi:nicotinamidase-related amidase
MHGPRNNPDAESKIAQLLVARRRRADPIAPVRRDATSPESAYRPGRADNEFESKLAAHAGEHRIPKRTNSVFIGTGLERSLRQAGLDPRVITGVSTNNTVATTVRMAGKLGFRA